LAKKVVNKPKAGTSLKAAAKKITKGGVGAKAGLSLGSILGGAKSTGKTMTQRGYRKGRRHGTMWYLRQVQRLRAKRRYEKERLRV
jgi:hypothetical protein